LDHEPLRGNSSCRLSLSRQGHVIAAKGNRRNAEDAEVSIWAFQTKDRVNLRLRIEDDRWVHEAPSWLATDHVELWLSGSSYGYSDHCVPPKRQTRAELVQYAIIFDRNQTRVQRAYGSARGSIASTQRWVSDGSLLLDIELRKTYRKWATDGAITVVYSDGDDGKTQKYLLASSTLSFADARSLGSLGKSVCRLRRGSLVLSPPQGCIELIVQ
jgi:hypothetical protein